MCEVCNFAFCWCPHDKIDDDNKTNFPPQRAGRGASFTHYRKLRFGLVLYRWGDSRSDGNQITLTQSDKWLRQAGVIDGWEVTTTDTAIFFRSAAHPCTATKIPFMYS